jgi:hypothetical protein
MARIHNHYDIGYGLLGCFNKNCVVERGAFNVQRHIIH